MRTLPPLPALALFCAACGAGSRGLVVPSVNSRSVSIVAFLDENRNGVLDGSEQIRIPGVEVSFGAVSGRSATSTGQLLLDVPETTQTLSVNSTSLPPYYRGPDVPLVAVPSAHTLDVPINLPVGPLAVPGVFLAFGDSITDGQAGVGDGQGYTGQLERMLSSHFGKARVINDGLDSSNTERGDSRLAESLASGRPAFTLILYGTNDWSDPRCGEPPCFTISNLRSMIQKVKERGGFPFLGTLLMAAPGNDPHTAAQRNVWIDAQNESITQLAQTEGVVLVDLHAAFEKSPLPYSQLFADSLHPAAAGYTLMAQAWFDAITRGR